jgi:sulfoxide reductase heme-binding subunit YedZ
MAGVGWDLYAGNIRGEVIKEIEHRIGYWGLILIVATLAITPLRRFTGWNRLHAYRRMLGLFAFFYIAVHFLVYLALDREFIFDPAFALSEIGGDIAKRPYITVGFLGFLLMIPLALTSTKGAIRRLGRKWVTLHSLVYVTALAGVVHFMWAVKADTREPTIIGAVLVVLLAARLLRPNARRAAAARTAPESADAPAALPGRPSRSGSGSAPHSEPRPA